MGFVVASQPYGTVQEAVPRFRPVRASHVARTTPRPSVRVLATVATPVPTKPPAPPPARVSGSWTCEASTYGYDYQGVAYSAASKEIPHGRHARVTAPNGRSVVVLITDSGPYIAGRCIDLSLTSFEALGYSMSQGVISGVRVEQID